MARFSLNNAGSGPLDDLRRLTLPALALAFLSTAGCERQQNGGQTQEPAMPTETSLPARQSRHITKHPERYPQALIDQAVVVQKLLEELLKNGSYDRDLARNELQRLQLQLFYGPAVPEDVPRSTLIAKTLEYMDLVIGFVDAGIPAKPTFRDRIPGSKPALSCNKAVHGLSRQLTLLIRDAQ